MVVPSHYCAWQGATQAGRARADCGAEEGDLDAVEGQQGFKAGRSEQPFWPQDQLVSDMAVHLALMVEQLGLSASPNDWTQVRSSWHDCRTSIYEHARATKMLALRSQQPQNCAKRRIPGVYTFSIAKWPWCTA